MRRTEAEIEDLKAQWRADGCWDIEDTDGFEAHAQELRAYRLAYEDEQGRERAARIDAKAADLGCSPDLVAYIERLEERLGGLERSATPMLDRLAALESAVKRLGR